MPIEHGPHPDRRRPRPAEACLASPAAVAERPRGSRPSRPGSRRATPAISSSIDGSARRGDRSDRRAALIGDAAIDVLVQPAAGRRKRLLVADLESTIIENEMLDELADFVGLRAHVAEITRRAMNGELDFVAALDRARRACCRACRRRARRGCRAHPADAGRARAGRDAARRRGPRPRSSRAGSPSSPSRSPPSSASTGSSPTGSTSPTARSPAPCSRRSSTARDQARDAARAGRRARRAAGRRRWRSATAPTTCRCCRPPGSASPFAPSPRSPPPRAGASTTPT